MAAKGVGAGLEKIKLRGKRLDARVEEAVNQLDIDRSIMGASTITIGLEDPERELVRSSLFNSRVALTFDDLVFELCAPRKYGDQLTLVFESAGVADLRKQKGALGKARGTVTRSEFFGQLVRQVRHLKYKAEPGDPVKRHIAREKNEDSWDCGNRLAGERRWRCFEAEGVVYFGSDAWLADLAQPIDLREYEDGIEGIDFECDGGQRADTATVNCHARLWSSRPGAPIQIKGLGELVEGVWLVESIRGSGFSDMATVSLTRKTKALPEPKPSQTAHSDAQGGSASGSAGSQGASSSGWIWPARGTLTGRFGEDRGDHRHAGIDIAAARGTAILAAKPGTVSFAGVMSGYGNCIDIDHGGGFSSRYGHLLSFSVRSGQNVERGEQIARMDSTGDSTGDHLHFEIHVNGAAVDPLRYLK